MNRHQFFEAGNALSTRVQVLADLVETALVGAEDDLCWRRGWTDVVPFPQLVMAVLMDMESIADQLAAVWESYRQLRQAAGLPPCTLGAVAVPDPETGGSESA